MDLIVSMLMLTGSLVALPVLAFITSYFFWPAAVVVGFTWFRRCRLGMKVHYVHCGNYRFCYSQRGQPGTTPSLLLLHGFAQDKDMWLPLIEYLPSSLHVVCVDLPGHGGTSRTSTVDYNYDGLVRRVHQFVQAVGLDAQGFHLLGMSMGGGVAGMYACRHQEKLTGLTLVCPAGLDIPLSSFLKDDIYGIIPNTLQKLEDLIKNNTYNPPKLPRQILQGIADLTIPHYEFHCELLKSISQPDTCFSLQQNMHLITVPLLVVWGKQDKMCDVSGASVLQAGCPDCQVVLMDKCGHSVADEKSRELAKLLVNFLSGQEVSVKKLC